MRRTATKRAFTLMELLVVISIIAILSAILFPVFGRAREAARKTTCISNVKQLTTAITMYRGDNDDLLMPAAYPVGSYVMPNGSSGTAYLWNHLLHPYVKNYGVFNCLSNKYTAPTEPYAGQLVTSFGYGLNPAVSGIADQSVNRVSDLIVISDARYYLVSPYGSDVPNPRAIGLCANVPMAPMYPIHYGTATVGFYDGHAKAIKPVTVYDQSPQGFNPCYGFNGKQEAWNPATP